MEYYMNLLKSISGSVDKAVLCVKKPMPSEKTGGITNQKTVSAVDFQAKLAALSNKGIFTFGKAAEAEAKTSGYHIFQVKYNPSSIHFDSRAGSFIQPGPGGEGTNTLSQITMPAQTFMAFEIILDDMNRLDAFMVEKFTEVSIGSAITAGASMINNIKGEGYSVQHEVEGLMGIITQSETRQVVFYWSGMSFAGEVVEINATYTMFNTLGNPVRAKVRFTLRQGGNDEDNGDNEYWKDAFDKLGKGGNPLSKVGNLLNLK